MLCYRCGSHVPDTSETCPTCGQKHDAATRQAAGGFSRRRAADAPYKPGDVVALRYAVRELVGTGPLGFVFKAHDQDTDVEVALKVINPRLVQAAEERTYFSQALRTARRLAHPHLLRVYEEGLDGDCPYFTMQLLEGASLRKQLEARAARGQRYTFAEVESLLTQLASALDDAHRLGPHADLKPENIHVLPDLVKVTDYALGLAIPRLPFIQAQKHVRADVYIAPEYIAGGEFDTRMDVYSLAVIVGELLTGLTPAEGVPPENLQQRFPELPPAFEALYRRALNANPLARPRTASEFLREFSALPARGPSAKPLPETFVPPPPGAAPASGAQRMPTPGRARRPGASGAAHAALVASARLGDKPPPPVPTDMLPAVSLAPAVSVPRASAQAEASTETTQPMDAAAVLRLVAPEAPPPSDATQPMDESMLAAIVNAPPAVTDPELAVPRPVAPAPPAPQPPAPPPRAAPAPVSAMGAATIPQVRRASKPVPWRWVLAGAGLVTGLALGALVLGPKSGKTVVHEVAPESPAAPSGPEAKAPPPVAEAPGAVVAGGACPQGMRLIPAGTFPMGTSPDERTKGFDERPLTTQDVPAFCMDEYEFPNVADSAPRVDVSWTDAKAACEHVGKRLCTEPEWEKACKGPKHLRFPYGPAFDANACNTEDSFGDDRSLAHSGQFSRCRSGYGVADLSGNVAEWTATPYTQNSDMTQKGGAFDRPDYAARCSARKNGAPADRSATVGFRCCAEVHP
ncbi:SUMF1/EgtB/PvdO family nonheme iron enzyme [Myxococcaceae bacterium GXIMD 01537]